MESYTSDADNVTINGTFSADESSISTPLHENMHAPVSTNTDNEERTTNVINPNVETTLTLLMLYSSSLFWLSNNFFVNLH